MSGYVWIVTCTHAAIDTECMCFEKHVLLITDSEIEADKYLDSSQHGACLRYGSHSKRKIKLGDYDEHGHIL